MTDKVCTWWIILANRMMQRTLQICHHIGFGSFFNQLTIYRVFSSRLYFALGVQSQTILCIGCSAPDYTLHWVCSPRLYFARKIIIFDEPKLVNFSRLDYCCTTKYAVIKCDYTWNLLKMADFVISSIEKTVLFNDEEKKLTVYKFDPRRIPAHIKESLCTW